MLSVSSMAPPSISRPAPIHKPQSWCSAGKQKTDHTTNPSIKQSSRVVLRVLLGFRVSQFLENEIMGMQLHSQRNFVRNNFSSLAKCQIETRTRQIRIHSLLQNANWKGLVRSKFSAIVKCRLKWRRRRKSCCCCCCCFNACCNFWCGCRYMGVQILRERLGVNANVWRNFSCSMIDRLTQASQAMISSPT